MYPMGLTRSPHIILDVQHLKKSYGGIKALDGVFFELKKGEVHALMGENGAGKSTFMKILAGLEKPDAGEIRFEGAPYTARNVQDALKKGISMIHQELLVVPELTIAENLFLGKEPGLRWNFWLNDKHIQEKATEWLDKVGLSLPPQTKMKTLSVAQMQMVEIAKALSNDAKVLIMDEPTSALSDREADRLFDIIRELRKKGVSIIYISHKMDEIFRIADSITVFRDAKYVDSCASEDLDQAQLISLMVGRKLSDVFPNPNSEKGAMIYSVRNLSRERHFHRISFELHAGEILGVAGLVGAGRTELARVLYGLDRADEGEVLLHDRAMLPASPQEALENGVGYVSEDRKTIGLVTRMSILQNLSLSSLSAFSSYGFIRSDEEEKAAMTLARSLQIKCQGLSQRVETLSGGNQQKVAIAKVLMAKPKVIILDEPTRGIDIGAKVEIYQLIQQLASEGLGVILISSELPEILALSDRVLVLAQGKQTALLTKTEATQERILYHAMPR
jgi:inositol transport system ATP-binding protein